MCKGYEFEAEHNGHVNILIWRTRLLIDLRIRGYFEWVRFQVSTLRYLTVDNAGYLRLKTLDRSSVP